MTIVELMELRREGPFNHEEYTVWLHNKIIEKIQYELWEFREQKAMKIGGGSGYAMCNHILSLPSLKPVK